MGSTLRTLLMSVKSLAQPALALFHSVNKHWDGNGFVFTFIPQVDTEARSVISALLPYLRAAFPKHSSRLDKFFTPSHIERANCSVWNDEKYCGVSEVETSVELCVDDDLEFDLTALLSNNQADAPPTTPAAASKPTRPNPSKLQGVLQYEGDTDSVPTLDSKVSANKDKKGRATGKTAAIQSAASAASSVTLESRLSAMEQHFQASTAATNEKLDCLFAALLTNHQSTNRREGLQPPEHASDSQQRAAGGQE